MTKTTKLVKIVISLTMLAAFTAACGPPKTLTDTITENELRQEGLLCQDYDGLELDLQPGKLVCSGELEGSQVVIEVIAEVVDGKGVLKILRFSQDGTNLPPEEFAETNAAVAEDAWLPDEGYAITSIIITENDLTITQSLK